MRSEMLAKAQPLVALVTGGSRGIGFGIAERLAREATPWPSMACARKQRWRKAWRGCALTAWRSCTRRATSLRKPGAGHCSSARSPAWGPPNLLVNNAGVAPRERRDLLEMTRESYDRVLATNLAGPLFLTQLVVRHMLAAREKEPGFAACVVNVSSISASVVSTNRGEYCIAKAGLAMLTQLFATRLGPLGIPVYEVRPGVIQTDMTAGVTAKYDQLIANGLCVQPRWGAPDDVGRAVAALARGDFPYSTGQAFLVDGGLTIPRL
jgi:3-oxoacyl-[acyl-carrier protein] reductase